MLFLGTINSSINNQITHTDNSSADCHGWQNILKEPSLSVSTILRQNPFSQCQNFNQIQQLLPNFTLWTKFYYFEFLSWWLINGFEFLPDLKTFQTLIRAVSQCFSIFSSVIVCTIFHCRGGWQVLCQSHLCTISHTLNFR